MIIIAERINLIFIPDEILNIKIYVQIFIKRMSFLIKVKKYFPGFNQFSKFIIDLFLAIQKKNLIFV